MFGFIANRITRATLEAAGVEKNTAKWIGRAVGVTVGVLGDPTGFVDIPDVPDTDYDAD
jgi:hypothetical protein